MAIFREERESVSLKVDTSCTLGYGSRSLVLLLLLSQSVAVFASNIDFYNNLLPITFEKLDFILLLLQYTLELYLTQSAVWFAGVKGGKYFRGAPVSNSSTEPLDAAFLFEESENNRCIVIFAPTKANIKDWMQNFNISTSLITSRSNESSGCLVRGGYYDAYMNPPYRQELEDMVDRCMVKNSSRKLILSGHSQGAAIAMVAAVVWEEYKPLVVAFGQPPTLVRRDDTTVCTALSHKNIWRFVNTENNRKNSSLLGSLFNEEGKIQSHNVCKKMDYDPLVSTPAFSVQWNNRKRKYDILLAYHYGQSIILPPGDTNGRNIVGTSVRYYDEWPYNTNFQKIENVRSFSEKTIVELLKQSLISLQSYYFKNLWNSIASAHDLYTYQYKFQFLKIYGTNPVDTQGLKQGSCCNYDAECQNSSRCVGSICSSKQ